MCLSSRYKCLSRLIASFMLAVPAMGLIGNEGAGQTSPVTRTEQLSGTESLLQAISVVSPTTAWIGGHDGVVLRTADGGTTWARVPTPAGDSLQYRDVHAFSFDRAVILSAGTGPVSRIYRTDDAGASWDLAYLMSHAEGFLDCMDFWDERGFAYGDEVDGVPFILTTADGGRSWSRPDSAGLPAALVGEGGFAASGTCARSGSDGHGWIATGAAGAARVLRTSDYGSTWTAVDVPVVRGAAAGLTTVTFHEGNNSGLAYGGDLANMDGRTQNAARTVDGGASWTPAASPTFAGPVYGSTYIPGGSGVLVVGPAGADYSPDGGRTWVSVDTTSTWAVASAGPDASWLVGPQGRIVKLTIP